jgi:DNA-binding MarR family transcriptional regulator
MSSEVARRQHAVKSKSASKSQSGSATKSAATPRTPEGDAFSTLVVQIFQLNGRLLSIGDELSAPAEQSSARWQVLAAVEHEPRPVAGIARVLGLARQSVQRVADLLEADGLARYSDNPSHQRAKLLELTDAGRAALAQIASAQHAWANRVGAELSLPFLRRASAALARLLEAVS